MPNIRNNDLPLICIMLSFELHIYKKKRGEQSTNKIVNIAQNLTKEITRITFLFLLLFVGLIRNKYEFKNH